MPRHTSVVQSYQVKVVEIKGGNFADKEGFRFRHGRQKMRRYDVRDPHKAFEKAQQDGFYVLGVEKAHREKVLPNIKNVRLLEPIIIRRDNAIALENIAFRRAKRIERNKDKPLDK